MSKTRKLSRRESRIAELELQVERLLADNVALKKELYNQKNKDIATIEDLQMLLMLHTTPANLLPQAG